MTRLYLIVFALLLTSASLACSSPKTAVDSPAPPPAETAAAETVAAETPSQPGLAPTESHEAAMPNGWIAAGQPSEERVKEIAQAGAVIISLRAPGEDAFDEAALVSSLGGTFERLPTSKASFSDPAYREQLYTLLDTHADATVYLHCASSNRVGAAWALYQAEHKGVAAEQALEMGRAAGMTRLEGAVRQVLGQ